MKQTIEVRINGNDYTLSERPYKVYNHGYYLEQYRKSRLRLIQQMGFPADVELAMLMAEMRAVYSEQEVRDFSRFDYAMVIDCAWQSLRIAHPGLSVADVEALLEQADVTEIMNKIALLEGRLDVEKKNLEEIPVTGTATELS